MIPDTSKIPPENKKTPSVEAGQEIGYATSINDYIIWVNGLPNVKIEEIVVSKNKLRGLVTAIKESTVEVLMLDEAKIQPQEEFYRTMQQLSIPIGSYLLGRTINPLGQPIDGKGGFSKQGQLSAINQVPPPIKARQLITRQFETGFTLIDTTIPIAYGQKELIIGDSHAGKTSFLTDTVINQKGKNIVCVYALIGKPVNEVKRVVEVLSANQALAYTIVVAASSSEKASLVYLTPQTATAIAEYFQKRGSDVLLILDDLGIHAKFYREISLLSGKAPGRQSYPGDIFFQHSKLIERGGNFNKEVGGGSITVLPVIEASMDDFTSYMTTNLMGMTDGHILFSALKYRQGLRPAVDISLSVSRVGRQTQSLAQKSLADRVKTVLAEGSKLETFARLGSEVSSHTQLILKRSEQIQELLKQQALVKIPIPVQMILLGLVFTPFFGSKDLKFVKLNKQKIISYLTTKLNLKKFYETSVTLKDSEQFIESLIPIIEDLEKNLK